MEFTFFLHILPLLTFLASISTLFVTLWVERKNRQKQEDLKYIEEKIKIYEPIVKNLRHALSLSQEDFVKFQKEILEDSYYSFWLYASENTIKSFNKFIDIRVGRDKNVSHAQLVELYKDSLLAMRQDIYPDNKLNLGDIRVLVNYNQK